METYDKIVLFDAKGIKWYFTPFTNFEKCNFTPSVSKNNVRATGVILYTLTRACKLLRPKYTKNTIFIYVSVKLDFTDSFYVHK